MNHLSMQIRFIPASQTLFTEAHGQYHVDGCAVLTGVVSLLSQVDISNAKLVILCYGIHE